MIGKARMSIPKCALGVKVSGGHKSESKNQKEGWLFNMKKRTDNMKAQNKKSLKKEHAKVNASAKPVVVKKRKTGPALAVRPMDTLEMAYIEAKTDEYLIVQREMGSMCDKLMYEYEDDRVPGGWVRDLTVYGYFDAARRPNKEEKGWALKILQEKDEAIENGKRMYSMKGMNPLTGEEASSAKIYDPATKFKEVISRVIVRKNVIKQLISFKTVFQFKAQILTKRKSLNPVVRAGAEKLIMQVPKPADRKEMAKVVGGEPAAVEKGLMACFAKCNERGVDTKLWKLYVHKIKDVKSCKDLSAETLRALWLDLNNLNDKEDGERMNRDMRKELGIKPEPEKETIIEPEHAGKK